MKTNDALREEIGQRTKVEATSERQRIQLLEAQRMANLGSWLWDVRTGQVTWSAQLYEIYGLKEDQFAGTPEAFLARVHPDDRATLEAAIAEAMRTGQGFRIDERIVRPDGEIRHLQSSGEVIRDHQGKVTQMLGICQDVTEQKKSIAALRESEETLRRLIDGVRDYAIYMMDPQGRIITWNAGAARIKGYTQEAVIGRSYSLFHTEEDREAGRPQQALETAARDGKYEGEGWRLRRDGSRFWAHVVLDAVRDEDGTLIGFAKITRDATEMREAQLVLEQTRDHLAHVQKMESIGRLTGGVAHDFNNHLMIVMGNLENLQRQLDRKRPDVARMKRSVENALRGAERSARLTERLLAFSRRQPLDPRPVPVGELVSGMLELLQSTLGEQIEIRTAFAADLWLVHVDPHQLENAIVNLAVNARDAMPGGGRLTIGANNQAIASGAADPDELAPGDYVALTVSDTGSGFAPEIIDRVFEPFFTTKEFGQGTGLGLSQVYGFTKQSGGHVRVDSEPGRGATITLYLPRTTRARVSIEVAEPPAAVPKEASRATVLLVEDDDDVRAYSNEILCEFGYRVLEASRADEALDLIERHPEVTLLFTDIGLPGGMNGRQLATEARRRRPELAVLLTTAYAREAIAADRLEAGMRLITKPFTTQALARQLSAVLEHQARMR
jgi:PAS domain S-box-containing protein